MLLRRRRRGGSGDGRADAVAPGNPDLGVMLPYTPLHLLLLGLGGDAPGPDVLVMTSGNLSGEPIVTDDAEALERLARLADAWLRARPADPRALRRLGRPRRRRRPSCRCGAPAGYAPLPVALPFEVRAGARRRAPT